MKNLEVNENKNVLNIQHSKQRLTKPFINSLKVGSIALAMFGLLSISACSNSQNKNSESKHNHEQAEAKQYTCSMHPEVVSDKPGDCPKCGMTLVEKTSEGHNEKHMHAH